MEKMMKKQLEVLLSVMNFTDEKLLQKKIKENNIYTKVFVVNQVENQQDIINYENDKIRVYSYNEKGASRSRNRLIENASGDICIFADDDMVYNDDYESIILGEFEKNKQAEIIIFNIKNLNSKREKIKKIRNKKINRLDILKVRSSRIAFRREIIEKYNIKFDEKFGPNGVFSKGEETVFVSDCLDKNINIISRNINIGYVYSDESSWFTGFNAKYLYDQGAIFYRISPKFYKIFILQYVIRKYKLYKKNLGILEAYKQMKSGAMECHKIYGGKNDPK